MDPGLRAIAEFGFTAVAVVVLALAVAFFIRDLVKQRDKWQSVAEAAIAGIERLTDTIEARKS